MFELSIALKYLTPRWRQLSVSIISLISILVIALVVWLIVVFFSVTSGLEKGWIQKLTALTAPVRVTPTQAYFDSYYYLVDGISANSDYTLKSIQEKLNSEETNPYDALSDEELPAYWAEPDLAQDGSLKDLVKLSFAAIHQIPDVQARDFEVTMSNLRLRLLRNISDAQQSQSFLSQATYLGSLDPENKNLNQAMLPISMEDISNLLAIQTIGSNHNQENSPETFAFLDKKSLQEKLSSFFKQVQIEELKTAREEWQIPQEFLPQLKHIEAIALTKNGTILRVFIPVEKKDLSSLLKKLNEQGHEVAKINIGDQIEILQAKQPKLFVSGNLNFSVELIPSSLFTAKNISDLQFKAHFSLQGEHLDGKIPYRSLTIAKAHIAEDQNLWLQKNTQKFVLPADLQGGEGILLPKTFRDAGVLLGDRGYLSYYTPTTSAVQEQRLPIFVAGFYDPGIIPIGGKFILANPQTTSMIRSAHQQEDAAITNGINVRFNKLERADEIKTKIQNGLKAAGIDQYWHVETYREYDFTKDLIQQLQSDKTLFMLISTVIIIVACSNIISMLIILVNDKKTEIGILRSMGASSSSIALIFGICGIVMGVTGSLLGTCAALLTLKNIDLLVGFLNSIQGHNAFNPMFYGDTLPNEVSFEALLFVIVATGFISLLAGIVPATKASLMKPSAILRAE